MLFDNMCSLVLLLDVCMNAFLMGLSKYIREGPNKYAHAHIGFALVALEEILMWPCFVVRAQGLCRGCIHGGCSCYSVPCWRYV